MSERNSTCSSARWPGIFSGPTLALGTRTNSACPPEYPPYRCVYPNMPAPDGICFLLRIVPRPGLVVSHAAYSSSSQKKHSPQEMVKGTTTRSPTCSSVTSGPTSSTIPMNSWPRMSPSFMPGTLPRYRCRSDPQMAVAVTRNTMSSAAWMAGSGTVSTRTSCAPCQVSAFMDSPQGMGKVICKPRPARAGDSGERELTRIGKSRRSGGPRRAGLVWCTSWHVRRRGSHQQQPHRRSTIRQRRSAPARAGLAPAGFLSAAAGLAAAAATALRRTAARCLLLVASAAGLLFVVALLFW